MKKFNNIKLTSFLAGLSMMTLSILNLIIGKTVLYIIVLVISICSVIIIGICFFRNINKKCNTQVESDNVNNKKINQQDYILILAAVISGILTLTTSVMLYFG